MLLFLSIVAITMMGVATYLSIHFSVLGIGRNTSNRYAELHFRDFEVISTKLLSPADLDAIRGLEGVAAAEPVWQTVGKAGSGEENEDVTVISITEEVNLPMVLEGRLPEDPGECAVEKRLMDKFGWEIGETIAVTGTDGEMPQYLLNSTFRITCIANHPDHMNTAAPDTLYIMLPRRAFDLDALENCSDKAEIILEKGADLSLFEEEYTSLADGMKKNLEALASEREQIRDREVLAKGRSELDENAKMLEDARLELEDARQQLVTGEAALAEAEKELAENKKQLEDAGKELEDASRALREGEAELADAKDRLIAGKVALLRAKDQLNYYRLLLADAKGQINAAYSKARSYLPDGVSPDEVLRQLDNPSVQDIADSIGLGDAASQLRSRIHGFFYHKSQIAYGEVDLKNAETYYHQGVEQYNRGFTEYEIGVREYDEKRLKYTQGLKDYEEAAEKISEAEKELQEKRDELEEKKKAYREGLQEYQDNRQMLSDAEETLDALQPARWILLRVMDNTSFAWQHGIITQTSQIQAVFSTFFLIISILVIYASVQKLVLEQRTLVGMGKALGLYNREILLKYLLFGLLGTTAGIILGTAAAYFVLQPLVLGTTNLFVLFDISRPLFDARSVLLTAAFLELVTFLSVYVACKALLRSSATVLMRTQVPKYQNKAAGRGSRHIPLMIRMIPRGMRANPGRVLVTVVSVAGCCALVVMGLTTKNRLDGVLTHQYPGITDYDLEVTFDGSADARDGIEEVLRSEGTEYVLVGSESVICEENGRTAAVLVTGSLEEIDAFYHLRDHHTGEPLPLNRKGCYIHRCFAEEFQLSPGDTVAVTLGLDTQARFSVGAVYDNYLGWNFFLCDADYEEAFGKASIKNQYYVRLGAADEALLKERLAKVPGFGKIDASDSDKEIFLSVSSTMNMLVVLMIVLAGILAAFVIVSLTKCYLLQKNNEAMIMRINGFTFREVIIYLMAEIIADMILGILLGFVVGQVLSVYMLSQMEADFYRTIRGIDVPAMILGAGITALFSLAVNAVCLRPLKRMKLTDLA